MFKRILMAYNGSRDGKSALIACGELAAFTQAQTHLLAVAGMPSGMVMSEGYPPEQMFDDEKKHAQQVLEEGLGQLRERGFSVTGHLAIGEPVAEICSLARTLKADLIIVGHAQRASFAARWWRGSVGKTLLDHAPCGIFIVPTGAQAARQ